MRPHFHVHGRRYMRGDWTQGERRAAQMRGGGRRRVFDQGDLRLVILKLLAERPRHGYDLIREIEARLGGAYSPSPGVVYPTLTLLEEMGHARVTSEEGGKKLYAATPEGETALAAHKAAIEAIFARIAELKRAFGGGPAPQIVRAMQNLRLALRMRLAQGPLTETQANAIVTALDSAAVAVERT